MWHNEAVTRLQPRMERKSKMKKKVLSIYSAMIALMLAVMLVVPGFGNVLNAHAETTEEAPTAVPAATEIPAEEPAEPLDGSIVLATVDDEQITVDLPRIPANVQKLVFVVNIYDAAPRHQHFGMIDNAFIRLVDLAKGTEICRFNLSENYDGMTGMIVGEIYRRGSEWKFNAVGQPVREASRLQQLLDRYK